MTVQLSAVSLYRMDTDMDLHAISGGSGFGSYAPAHCFGAQWLSTARTGTEMGSGCGAARCMRCRARAKARAEAEAEAKAKARGGKTAKGAVLPITSLLSL